MGRRLSRWMFSAAALFFVGGGAKARAQTLSSAPYSAITSVSVTANWNSTFAGGTNYLAQLSTGAFPNSFSGNQSSTTANLYAVFSGLSPSIVYFGQVSTNTGGGGPNVSLYTTETSSGVTAAAFTTVNSNYLTANWTTTFPGGTLYFVNLSTGAFPNSFTGNQSSTTANLNAPFAGLSGSTLYFVQVGTSASGPFTSLGSTVTLPSPAITAAPFTTVNSNYFTSNWTTTYSTGTFYYANLSSGAFPNAFTGNQSSNTFNLNAPFGNLSGSTLYFVQVGTAATGPFTSIGSTATALSPVITPAPFSTINNNYLTTNWTTTYSTGTFYYVNLSSGAYPNAFTGNQSSNTFNLYAPFSGLAGSTTYYAQVSTAATGPFTSLGSAPTVPNPVILPLAFTAISSYSLTTNWYTTYATGTFYYTQLSSGAFPNGLTNQSSNTFNLSATYQGLLGGGTYYTEVSTAATGPFVALGFTPIPPPPPAIAQTSWTAVSVYSLTVNWNSTLAGGTTYYVNLSSGPFPNSLASNQSATTLNLYAPFGSLLPATTYYAQVSTSLPGPYTSVGAQQTLPLTPGTPGMAAAAVLSTTAINWTWTLSSNATSYRVYENAGGSTLLAATGALSYSETGLGPNTPHILQVAGTNAGGVGPLSPAPAMAYTFANPPAGTSASAIWATSVTISWLLNSNSPGTTADVQFSTNDVSFSSIFTATTTSVVPTGLLGCTSYYFGVRNLNFAGVGTIFDSTITVRTANTVPAPASGLTATPLAGNQVALSWVASPTEGITQYNLYYDAGTGTVGYGAPLAVVAAPQTTFTTGVLASSAAYTFAVRAAHRCGATETTGVFAIAAATATLSPVRAVVSSPRSGTNIAGNNVTISAILASGTPGQAQQIIFQYRVSGTTAWANILAADPITHPNPADPHVPFIHWNTAVGVAAGNYDVRALAISVTGSSDTAPAAITVGVGSPMPDVTESNIGGIDQTKQVVNNQITNNIAAGGAGLNDPMCAIVLPPNALANSTVTFTVTSNPAITTGPPAGLAYVGSAMQVDLDNNQHNLSGGSLAQITLSYPDTAFFPGTFQIYSLNPTTGIWTKDFNSTVNTTSHTVTGFTWHFSVFAIVAGSPAAPDLSAVRVYPNPFMPNRGIADTGKTFDPGDPTSGIVFDNLPTVVTITIYTASGRMVAKFDSSNGSGTVHWDGKNQDGRDVSSGGYIAVITAPGQKNIVRKLAIIR